MGDRRKRAAARKHHVTVDELGEVLKKYQDEIAALQSGEATLTGLEAGAAAAREDYLKLARKLSDCDGASIAECRIIEALAPTSDLAA